VGDCAHARDVVLARVSMTCVAEALYFCVCAHVCIRVLIYSVSWGWSVICCQEWGCAWLLVGKLGHTGLVPFVDELGTICGEVPLEYGFAVPIWSEQHRVCFLMHNCVILSSAPSVQTQKHRWAITQSCVTLQSQSVLGLVPFVDYLSGFP